MLSEGGVVVADPADAKYQITLTSSETEGLAEKVYEEAYVVYDGRKTRVLSRFAQLQTGRL